MDGTAGYIFIGTRRICTKELIHAFPLGKSAAVTLSRVYAAAATAEAAAATAQMR